ncbi:aldehyde dehydrogenase family protein, partial [Actinomadura roseirufa]|uniref:aldehyde dehydrogenase family protein n=1 Tax=Actinomadura roseirufa TaxID=2094049 RepID=UPI001041B76F
MPVAPSTATLLIDGEWRAGSAAFEVVDPATLEVVARAADAGPREALAALDAACAAFPSWRETAAEERAAGLR